MLSALKTSANGNEVQEILTSLVKIQHYFTGQEKLVEVMKAIKDKDEYGSELIKESNQVFLLIMLQENLLSLFKSISDCQSLAEELTPKGKEKLLNLIGAQLKRQQRI